MTRFVKIGNNLFNLANVHKITKVTSISIGWWEGKEIRKNSIKFHYGSAETYGKLMFGFGDITTRFAYMEYLYEDRITRDEDFQKLCDIIVDPKDINILGQH